MNSVDASLFSHWDPTRVKSISEGELRYANGFLRSNPLRWIGAIKNYWTGILEGSGVEMRLIELKTSLDVDQRYEHLWAAKINSYPIAVSCDATAIEVIYSIASKLLKLSAKEIVLDYFGRRLLGTLAMSWNGPALESFTYVPEAAVTNQQWAAAVNVKLEISGQLITFTYLLSAYILDVLDGLWLRQRLAAAKKQGELLLNVEVGDTEINSGDLSNYISSGKIIPFSGNTFEAVQLVVRGENAIFGGRLVALNGKWGIRVLSGNKALQKPVEGKLRLGFVLSQIKINAEKYAEVSQPGAILITEIAMSSRVAIFANGSKQAEGNLGFLNGQAIVMVG